jgi:hypothetical protein
VDVCAVVLSKVTVIIDASVAYCRSIQISIKRQ